MIQVREEFIREAYQAACESWKRKLEKEFPLLFQFYKPGQRFEIFLSGDGMNHVFILARVKQNSVALIDLVDGNRFSDPIDVVDSCQITHEEFKKNYRYLHF